MEEVLRYVDAALDIMSHGKLSEIDVQRVLVKLALAIKTIANIYMEDENDLK